MNPLTNWQLVEAEMEYGEINLKFKPLSQTLSDIPLRVRIPQAVRIYVTEHNEISDIKFDEAGK